MMFLTNTTPTKQARKISVWSKEAIGKLSDMVIGYMMIHLAISYNLQCYSLQYNAIIYMGRCFKFIGCKVLSVAHILL